MGGWRLCVARGSVDGPGRLAYELAVRDDAGSESMVSVWMWRLNHMNAAAVGHLGE